MQALPTLILLLTSRWSRGLLGASILSVLIWSFLPAVPAFASPLRRAIAIVVVFAAFAIVSFIFSRRAKKRARAVEAAVDGAGDAAGKGKPASDEAQAELTALRTRLREAIAALRKRGVKRLYELPWYVIIGPPGAGKTTALRHSGLHFPLDAENADPLAGVGGTRLCDWWFSEEAVLIDTAGRYTTQDSNRSVDKAGWLGFLDLLRQTRPRQPVNGVIVVIALPELLESTPEGRDAHARAIRLRINELNERLRVRLPVYVVLSKMDRLAGFDSFFESLDSTAREQVWGVTFSLNEGQEAFAAAFRDLVERIDNRLIDRLQAERGADRRALLSGFPLQLASLEPILLPFLATCFAGSRIDPAPFLRGVYMTSATQNGTPFDRLTGMLARSFDIDQKRVPALRPAAGRAFFLKRLVHEVILGETLLVSTTPSRYRRRKILRATALVSIAAITLVGLVGIWVADLSARIAVQRKQDAFNDYRHEVEKLPAGPVGRRDDIVEISQVLDKAAALEATDDQPIGHLLGLSTAPKLREAGRVAYADALDHLLYPRLVWRLEQQIREHMQDPATLYDATRVYLLLGGAGPHEPDVIRQWVEADWAQRFGGGLNAQLRAHLARHLDALLARPLPSAELPLDGGLVSQARIGFSHVSPAQRIYDRLRADAAAADNGGPVDGAAAAPGASGSGAVSGWSPEGALGRVADDNFVRGSGASLSEGVAEFFTGHSFAAVMSQELPPAARAVADESWVVGRDPDITTGGGDVADLERQVAELWARDATTQWDSLLGDLELLPLGDRQHTQDRLYLLSSPQSPLRDMLVAIARALRIAPPPAGDPSGPVAVAWNAHWQPLFDLVGLDPKAAANAPSPPGGKPIDGILHLIEQLDNELAVGSATPTALPGVAGQSADPAQRLLAEASRQPRPLSIWLGQIAQAGGATLGAEAKQAASGAYHAANGPDESCHALVDGHYPFDPNSSDDAPLAGFARVFAPGGALDQYFQTSMAPYVDTTGQNWRLHPAGGVNPPFTAAQLGPFHRAVSIRQAFFPVGSAPALYFSINVSAPAGVLLHLGGVTVTPGLPASLSWPGSDSLSPASITLTKDGKTRTALTENGQWALFHLLADADLAEAGAGPSAHRYTLNRGGVSVKIEIDAGSGAAPAKSGSTGASDPFSAQLLAGFACPRLP